MYTKYEAACTLIEGQSNGERVSLYGTDSKGRLLRITVHISELQHLVEAYNECQSTGHAAWHVQNKADVPCSFCGEVNKLVAAERAQIAWNEEWKRTHDENGNITQDQIDAQMDRMTGEQ